MVSRFALFTVLAAAATTAFGQVRVETPQNVVACRPVQFTFTGGTPPYFLTICAKPYDSAHPAGQPAAPATVDFGEVESSPFRWTPNIPVGTNLFLRIVDDNGETGESGPFSVLNSSDLDCIGQEPSGSDAPPAATDSDASSASTPAATTGAPAASTSAPATSGGASTPAGSSSRPASSAASSARPSTSAGAGDNDGAALSTFVSSGALGLAAIAGAALLL
ncbi:hypothetical protein BKA70DRAFT_1221978 [Coprinopsis sp. MPI-PUGE-AT-0042]|nr:hypothetical protein BKA70DRAFT_1221978 [Coprinopsis sp. MPI-PUGE-AT-0042]